MQDIENVSPDLESLSVSSANLVSQLAERSIKETGAFTIALTGGSTAKKLYEVLSSPSFLNKIEWQKVQFFIGDERIVPPGDSNSNLKLANDFLLSKLPIDRSQVHLVDTTLPEESEMASDYESDIRKYFNTDDEIPAFDLILLGMGSDGHIASLFPGKEALKEETKLVTNTVHGVLPPPINRITFTLPLINAAKNVMIMVAGGEKKDALYAAQNKVELFEGEGIVPASMVQPTSGELIWCVDKAIKGL